ncbi:iron-enterobactin ABC transporter permease [Pseudomonas sp. RIT-To-2]|uniref:iron-enterobactin ABC transporter permease n=1 Tax=Pseudomonas sp. RIT-To-2 TaxID=3462541 RepID=UPI002413CC14
MNTLREHRPVTTATALALLCLALGTWALASGSLTLGLGQVMDALRGAGPQGTQLVVLQWRLPRVATALVLGAALGVSGAIFQSLMRNPLGSPDIMGFNTGAYSGVLVALVLFPGNTLGTASAALLGGLITALAVYRLAWCNGISTLRLIIVALGVRALLVSFNTWVLVNGSLEATLSAGLWNAGSLNGMTWAKAVPALLCIAVALVASLALSLRLRLLEMGDDTASALGVPVERSRLVLLMLGVVLTAAATAIAGPISFVALAAPQIARRISPSQRLALPMAALTGALLLMAADLAAQRLFLPYQLHVGLITVSLGGLYLIGLLIRETRKR